MLDVRAVGVDDKGLIPSPCRMIMPGGGGTGWGSSATLKTADTPRAASCEVLLFLNSDTVVPRAGLFRLIKSLMSAGTVGAAGPLSNRVGHGQQIDPTYTKIENMPLFAEDFTEREVEDRETDMLVGFCLAVRRWAWDEIGGFDERFGLGMFEDNNLCYRIRRAGYQLLVSNRSFVHYEGLKTL